MKLIDLSDTLSAIASLANHMKFILGVSAGSTSSLETSSVCKYVRIGLADFSANDGKGAFDRKRSGLSDDETQNRVNEEQ
jgi:hypothetical protein